MAFKITRVKTLAIAAALVMTAATPALAQQGAPGGQQAPTAAQSQNFSDELILAYANTAVKVSQVHREMAPQIQAAESQQQKEQMTKTMQQQMVGVVQQSEGITVQEYSQITQAAQQNPQLAQKIQSTFQSMQPKQ